MSNKYQIPEQYKHEKKIKKWMWVGVGTFVLMILFFWALSAKMKLENVDWGNTQEKNLIKNTTQNWDEIFVEEKEKQLEEDKEEVKEKIQAIIKDLDVASSSVSSTPDTTTTTILTTTTK